MSKKYNLNLLDIKSILITLAIVGVSAIVAQAIELVPGINFGDNSDVIILILVAVLKGIQKFLQGK